MFLSETKSTQAYEDIIFPFDHPSCFYHSFLLSDTVPSASVHRLTESWGWVQSMLGITRRRTMERPITMADPLKMWSQEPNKVCFQPALESHVFRVKQVFLITDMSGQEGKAEFFLQPWKNLISAGSEYGQIIILTWSHCGLSEAFSLLSRVFKKSSIRMTYF